MSKTKRILTLSAQSALAAALMASAPLGAQAAECFDKETSDPKAGDATAVVGPSVGVKRNTSSDFVRPDAGDDLFTGDRVRTGSESHLQIKLCDWSTYTFSPESEAAISEFYDERGAGQRRVVNFVRGGFRYGSGRDTEPGSTEVEVQESGVTMGVRGTNVLLVELDGLVYALLEGPALDNSGLSPQGLVDFWQGNEAEIVASLKRPGYVVTIGPDGVSRPFRASPQLLRRIYEAFVPVIPDEDGSPVDYEQDPLRSSGQGPQEAGAYSDYVSQDAADDDEATDRFPEQPYATGDIIQVGDILPLDVLEEYVAAQGAMPDGHIFALAPARFYINDGSGETLADEGVALVQIHVDWATRTVAPEALASFLKYDFSVSDASDLTIDDYDISLPPEAGAAYRQAILSSYNLPFSSGQNGLSVLPADLYTFIFRQGPGDTVTVDVESDISVSDSQNNMYRVETSFLDLMLLPGEGELAAFNFDFAEVRTPGELENIYTRGGVSVLRGYVDFAIATADPTILPGVAFAQLEVDFVNRTIGGGASFMAITGPTYGTAYAPLNSTTSFDAGLFGLAFYPLSSISSDPSVLKGQVLIATINDQLGANITAILADESGDHLYSDFPIMEGAGPGVTPLATVAGLDANTENDFLGMGISFSALGGTLHYDGTYGGRGEPGLAQLDTATGLTASGDLEVSIDINFANRTIGGGNSFVAVSINDSAQNVFVNFAENIGAASFDDAVSGAGVVGFDAADFNGSNMNSALLLIRDNPQTPGQGEFAEMFVNFTDGENGKGYGETGIMPLTDFATSPPSP